MYLGRSNHSALFLFFGDTEPTHRELRHPCLAGVTGCHILTCLWEVFSILWPPYNVSWWRKKPTRWKTEVWEPLCDQRDCWEHKRPVSLALILWRKAGQLLRLPFFLSLNSFGLMSTLWKTLGSEQLFSKSLFSELGRGGVREALSKKEVLASIHFAFAPSF